MKQIIVDSETQFDSVLQAHAIKLQFTGDADERTYECRDRHLAEAIQSLMVESFGASNEGTLFHQNFDWWPNCTRSLEMDSSCITWTFLRQLKALLHGEVRDWRVHMHVYRPLAGENSEHVGGLNLHSTWVLMQQ